MLTNSILLSHVPSYGEQTYIGSDHICFRWLNVGQVEHCHKMLFSLLTRVFKKWINTNHFFSKLCKFLHHLCWPLLLYQHAQRCNDFSTKLQQSKHEHHNETMQNSTVSLRGPHWKLMLFYMRPAPDFNPINEPNIFTISPQCYCFFPLNFIKFGWYKSQITKNIANFKDNL